ncbi:MAG: hypothetical protein ACLFSY_03940 [Desulfonatronovibrionaceae bacterium]
MVDKVSALPGRGCEYYLFGRCIYEELLNPGYHTEWRCGVISGLVRSFDFFLEQVEIFSLSRSRADAIWKQRISARCPVWKCPDFSPDPENRGECLFLFRTQCILKIPACTGRCRLYTPARAADGKART